MGLMTFLLPADLSAEAARELSHACVAGGPDNMPWPTSQKIDRNCLTLQREVDESGYLVTPWPIDGAGHIVATSGTLMQRAAPYSLVVELARGRINQLRNQLADWRSAGLQVPSAVENQVREAALAFARTIAATTPEDGVRLARGSIALACRASDELVRAYTEQVFAVRHQRQPKLDATLGCRLTHRPPAPPLDAAFTATFNSVAVPMSWHIVESEEASYRWDEVDALVNWAVERGLNVTAGPLVDFSSAQLPAWLWLWESDLPSMATFMCKFVEAAVRRYRQKIRRWQFTAASNCATVLHLSEDELLGLTYRLGEAARQIDPNIEVVVGVSQPWGEYMALEDRTHSPFIFADTLIRSGLNPSAVNLEVVMGVTGRGSYCRDPLDFSRMLDLYALLGVPLQVTLGYPSSSASDTDADPEMSVGFGRWRDSHSPAIQADWAEAFASLALCKHFVQGLTWTHFSDAEPHQFPHCGVVDAQSQPKPALERLRALRTRHLR
jgi:hypothetical protein